MTNHTDVLSELIEELGDASRRKPYVEWDDYSGSYKVVEGAYAVHHSRGIETRSIVALGDIERQITQYRKALDEAREAILGNGPTVFALQAISIAMGEQG